MPCDIMVTHDWSAGKLVAGTSPPINLIFPLACTLFVTVPLHVEINLFNLACLMHLVTADSLPLIIHMSRQIPLILHTLKKGLTK